MHKSSFTSTIVDSACIVNIIVKFIRRGGGGCLAWAFPDPFALFLFGIIYLFIVIVSIPNKDIKSFHSCKLSELCWIYFLSKLVFNLFFPGKITWGALCP